MIFNSTYNRIIYTELLKILDLTSIFFGENHEITYYGILDLGYIYDVLVGHLAMGGQKN